MQNKSGLLRKKRPLLRNNPDVLPVCYLVCYFQIQHNYNLHHYNFLRRYSVCYLVCYLGGRSPIVFKKILKTCICRFCFKFCSSKMGYPKYCKIYSNTTRNTVKFTVVDFCTNIISVLHKFDVVKCSEV